MMIIRSTSDTYRKLFLFTTVPFGLFTGILVGLTAGPWYGLVAGIKAGLFYGFFMTLIVGGLHKISTKWLKIDCYESLLGVHQVEVITLEQSFEDAFATCQSSLQELNKCRITQQDKEFGVIRAQAGMTWKSFGEKILLTVSPDGIDTCKVTVSSKPAVKTTLLDYGKNAENIRSIVDSLRRRTAIAEAQTTVPQLLVDDEVTDGAGNYSIKLITKEAERAH